MRLGPWKLAALVLLVACAHEIAMPDVAHAPGRAASSANPVEAVEALEAGDSTELDESVPR